MEQRIIAGLHDMPKIVDLIQSLMRSHRVFTLTGTLGAGKSTLVREVLRARGVTDPITSPTFTYLNLYKNGRGQRFFHFDCYRVGSTEDFVAAGFDEYLYEENSWTFIEWPEVVMPLLRDQVCHVVISYYGPEQREFIIRSGA